MEEMIINNEIDTKDIKEISDEILLDTIKDKLEIQLIIESVKKVKDPFKMFKVEDVAKDLGVCYSTAYKLFKTKDFPAVKVGGSSRVAYISYMIWKMRNLRKENK